MKCPFKEDNFGRMPDCQPDCAWKVNDACAIAALCNEHVDANDAHAAQDMDNGICVRMCPNDSREKLEAELHNILHCAQITIVAKAKNEPFDWYTVDGYIPMICELLDRQAAITERETEKKWSCFSDSADGHIAELSREIGTLRAERDHYRELCGKLLDAADDMRRVRDQFDAFTEVD